VTRAEAASGVQRRVQGALRTASFVVSGAPVCRIRWLASQRRRRRRLQQQQQRQQPWQRGVRRKHRRACSARSPQHATGALCVLLWSHHARCRPASASVPVGGVCVVRQHTVVRPLRAHGCPWPFFHCRRCVLGVCVCVCWRSVQGTHCVVCALACLRVPARGPEGVP
jgi:hypothetical protein